MIYQYNGRVNKTKVNIVSGCFMWVFIKSVIAGMLIGIGCVVFLMCPDRIVGSFLFSFGLFSILNMELNLYTGKIGYLVLNFNWEYIRDLGITLVGNFIGTLIVALLIKLTRLNIMESVSVITAVKLNDSYISMFILAVFCGMLMYLGVDLFKTIDSYLGKFLSIMFAVMIFILSGFEHCIADMFYFMVAGNLDVVVILIVIFGNTLGGMLLCYLHTLCKKQNSNKEKITT